jgi:AhpD family alkylhydroperoxidase
MKIRMNKKIESIIKTRREAHSWFMKKSAVYKSFVEMEQKTYTNRALSKKQKELIATGISVCINCESCMEWHIKQALDENCTEEEIIEALRLGLK